MGRRIGLALLVLALSLATTTAAFAKGGGNGHGGASASTATGGLLLSDPAPHFGEVVTITATYSIPNGVKYSVGVSVTCTQAGNPVYMYVQFTQDGSPFAPQFTLGPSSVSTPDGTYFWTSGGAHCAADLFYYEWQGQIETGVYYLAHQEFDVSA